MSSAPAQGPAMLPASRPLPSQDPDLSLRAARAAAEVDQLILGTSTPGQGPRHVVDALEGFVSLLNNDVQGAGGGQKSFMDPASSRIFVRAYEQSNLNLANKKIRSYVELGDVLKSVLEMLQTAHQKGLDRPKMERLRSFFIYLSDFAAAERRTFVSRPKQPYRR